jgi:hypothetical protein
MLDKWLRKLRFNPLPPLMTAENQAIRYFAARDLASEKTGGVEDLWQLPQPKSIANRQLDNGAWRYPGGGSSRLRETEDYNQLETYRNLGELIEKYGMDKRHETVRKAASYLFSRQTDEGDFRGIYGTQYSPNYSAAIMELLIKAGHSSDSRIEKGFQWLLKTRQNDGGWAIPVRTAGFNFNTGILKAQTLKPDKTKPFSHLVTGIVLRAFAAHEKHRTSNAARTAGELVASRFFRRDAYPDRQNVDYWFRFSYPFWQTDLLSSLGSLSKIGFVADHPQVVKALAWFVQNQQENGEWRLKLVRGRDKSLPLWISLAVCRVFKRFYG